MVDDGEEAELVARAQGGDPMALDALIARYDRLLRTGTAGLTEGEDHYQEAVLTLVELVHRYEPALGVAFGTFLERHLHWLVANRRRDRRRAQYRTTPLDDELLRAIEEGRVGAGQTPIGFARQGLGEAITALRSQARTVFVRYYFGGESIPALADEIGVGERAIRRLIQRVEDRIRRELAE